MQLSAIRTEVQETAGLASTDSRFGSATLNRMINRALRRLDAKHDWPWNYASETITTAASDADYAAPTNYNRTIRLRYNDRDLMQYAPSDTARWSSETGAPYGFYIEEEQIHIVPTPDGVYSVEHIYVAFETALSSDSDSPSLPDMYIDALVQETVIQVAQATGDTGMYQMARTESRDWERRMHDDVRRARKSPKIRTRYDWWI